MGDCLSSPSDHEYALYLLPRGFRRAYRGASRGVRHAVDEVKRKGDWGGLVHIPLCSFSEPSCTRSMRQGARSAAGAGNQVLKRTQARTFHITKGKWKRDGDKWDVSDSRTLDAVSQAVSNSGAPNPRKQRHVQQRVQRKLSLHVYMPLKSLHQDKVVAFLAKLKWDVAVVSRKRGDKHGKSLRVLSRHSIGR